MALQLLADLRSWPMRRWWVAGIASILVALLTGVPTDLVDTRYFTRMTPVRWWDYPVWLTAACLAGLAIATYVRRPAEAPAKDRGTSGAGRTVGASALTVFAVGCPVCNKLVVAVLGVSGALTYFEPLQPALALASLALLVTALLVRLRGERSCDLPRATA